MPELLPGSNSDIRDLERFAGIRLVVADLDGTLLPSELEGKIQRLLRQLNSVGVRVTLATGRTYNGVRELLSLLHDNSGKTLIKRGTPLILYNGAIVVEASTQWLMWRKTISNDSFRSIMHIASQHDCELFAYFCNEAVLDTRSQISIQEHVHGWQFSTAIHVRPEHEFNGLSICWGAQLPPPAKLKPCAIVLKTFGDDAIQFLLNDIGTVRNVSVTRSGSAYLELRPRGSNKGVALSHVADQLGYERQQILTIGDNDNDAEMLKWAGIGVAVSTASALARDSADFICHFGSFQGVVQVLRLICDAHRYYRGHESSARIRS